MKKIMQVIGKVLFELFKFVVVILHFILKGIVFGIASLVELVKKVKK